MRIPIVETGSFDAGQMDGERCALIDNRKQEPKGWRIWITEYKATARHPEDYGPQYVAGFKCAYLLNREGR